MPQAIKFDKRIAEEVEGLKKLAQFLPDGKARQLLNRCNRISTYARKGKALIEAPVGTLFPPIVHDTTQSASEDIKARHNAKKAVFEAMCRGRRVSLENEEEFRTWEMHTTICYIRKDIERKNLPWILCSREKRPDPSRRGYNEWWLVPKPVEE